LAGFAFAAAAFFAFAARFAARFVVRFGAGPRSRRACSNSAALSAVSDSTSSPDLNDALVVPSVT
jgi:hypothetical protein